MGFGGLFKSERTCDVCGALLPKKQLNSFDPTWRHSRKSGDTRRAVCSNCLPSVLGEYLGNFEYRALAIEPVAEPAEYGYSFAPIDLPDSNFVWDAELKDQVRNLFPPTGAACSHCGAAAHFNWCGASIFVENPLELDLKARGEFPERLLCGVCVAGEFEKKFQEVGVILREVLPPADGDGFLGPGEY